MSLERNFESRDLVPLGNTGYPVSSAEETKWLPTLTSWLYTLSGSSFIALNEVSAWFSFLGDLIGFCFELDRAFLALA